MIVHKTVGVTEPVIAFDDDGQDFQELFPVRVVFENNFFIVAPGGDMVDGSDLRVSSLAETHAGFATDLPAGL
jgi:hypothetical protein